jgi:hypothetical protein
MLPEPNSGKICILTAKISRSMIPSQKLGIAIPIWEKGNHDGNENPQHRQGEGEGEALEHQFDDRLAADQGLAEVETDDLPQPLEVLCRKWLVGAQLGPDRGYRFLGGVHSRYHQSRVAGYDADDEKNNC